jgi:AcrR family transcriptional regulator
MPRASTALQRRPGGTRRAAEARARMYRDLVLESAERVFAGRGFHASRMEEVAAEAGVSLSTVYAAFPSKRELFEALHEARGRDFLARLEPALSAQDPVLVCLRRAVESFVDWLAEHRDYLHVDLREGRSWAIGDVEGSRAYQEGIALWTELLRRGIREGVFEDGDPRLLATTAFAIMQVQLAYLLERGERLSNQEIAGRIARQLERAFATTTAPPVRRSSKSIRRRTP